MAGHLEKSVDIIARLRRSSQKPSIVLFLFMWTVIAVVAATTTFIALRGSTLQQWLTTFGYMLAFFYTWAPISFFLYWLIHRQGTWQSRWFVQLPLHIGLLATITVSLAFLVHPLTWELWLYGERAMGFHALNTFIYAFILIGSMMLKYYRLVRAKEKAAQIAERRQAALERSLDQSRMEALRAQINPHFLFNTLNSIASLVESSSNREAYKVIELLAALLRNALDFSRDSVVALENELNFLDAYVEIEKIRYGRRLNFTRSVPDSCLKAAVPALSLQPLVENAIKHAVALSSGPVNIDVRVSCSNGVITIVVKDDGPGIELPIKLGVGLTNVQDRLAYLFDGNASFDIRNNKGGGATATLTLPDWHSTAPEIPQNEKKNSQMQNLNHEVVPT